MALTGIGCIGPIGMSVLFAARAAGAERICVTDRLTHRFSFAQTPAAMALVAGYRDGVMKAMIHVNS